MRLLSRLVSLKSLFANKSVQVNNFLVISSFLSIYATTAVLFYWFWSDYKNLVFHSHGATAGVCDTALLLIHSLLVTFFTASFRPHVVLSVFLRHQSFRRRLMIFLLLLTRFIVSIWTLAFTGRVFYDHKFFDKWTPRLPLLLQFMEALLHYLIFWRAIRVSLLQCFIFWRAIRVLRLIFCSNIIFELGGWTVWWHEFLLAWWNVSTLLSHWLEVVDRDGCCRVCVRCTTLGLGYYAGPEWGTLRFRAGCLLLWLHFRQQ